MLSHFLDIYSTLLSSPYWYLDPFLTVTSSLRRPLVEFLVLLRPSRFRLRNQRSRLAGYRLWTQEGFSFIIEKYLQLRLQFLLRFESNLCLVALCCSHFFSLFLNCVRFDFNAAEPLSARGRACLTLNCRVISSLIGSCQIQGQLVLLFLHVDALPHILLFPRDRPCGALRG